MRKSFFYLILEFILGGAVIMLTTYIFDDVYVKDFGVACLIAIVLALLNTFVKPVLSFIAFPITILSLGLFQLVINGFVLEIAQMILAPDFYIPSFGLTILMSVVISILYSLLGIGKIND